MNEGWIKIHRKLLENPRYKDGDWLKVWLWMLLRASHGGHSVIFKGERIQLQPGQFTAGRFQISEQTGVNQSKVFRVLEALKSEQQIEQQISNACSLFTITKWASYQKLEQQNEQPANSQRTAIEQPNKQRNEQPKNSVKTLNKASCEVLELQSEQLNEQHGFRQTPSKSSTNQEDKKTRRDIAPRARNIIFDALAEVCGMDPSNVTKPEGGRIATAAAHIKQATPDVTPEEIRQRASNYRKVMPKGSMLTPTALSSNWTICAGAAARDYSDAELTLMAMGKK